MQVKSLATKMKYYFNKPAEWVEDTLGATPDDWQVTAFEGFLKQNFVSIKSGHGVGKTTWLAWLLLWFLMTRPFSKIPCTAPSKHQLFDVLWAECSYWINQSPLLKEALEFTSTKIAMKGYEATWFAAARTARVDPKGRVTEGLQGFHAPFILIIVDEASGVDERVFSALEGALTSTNAYMAMVGNPTRLAGSFYKSHTIHKNQYYTDTVSCMGRPHRVPVHWIERQKKKWGLESPEYSIKVLGEFPEHMSTNAILGRSVMELLIQKEDYDIIPIFQDGTVIWAIDIARFGGAKTCLATRVDNVLVDILNLPPRNTPQTADLIHELYLKSPPDMKPSQIRIDIGGGYGAGVYDICMLKPDLTKLMKPINFAWSPMDTNAYLNLRAESYWTLKRKMEELRMTISPSCSNVDSLTEQLCDLKYFLTTKEKIQIEPKEGFMSRHQGQSPDESDAVAMVFLDNWIEGSFGIEDNIVSVGNLIPSLTIGHTKQELNLSQINPPSYIWKGQGKHIWNH